MNTISPTVAALERYCGFEAGSTRARIRALTEGGLIEPGGPGKPVEITEADFVLLLLALASGAPLHAVADVVAELADTLPTGVDVNVMPATSRPAKQTAYDALHDLVWSAAHGDLDAQSRVSKINVEVVETWREVALHTPDGVVRFLPTGALSGRWQGDKQRRATTIPGTALVGAVRAIFAEESANEKV